MAKRTPKSDSYSCSQSAYFRFASVVGQKNRGEGYLVDALTHCGLEAGNILYKRIKNVTKVAETRALELTTLQFKQNRQDVRKRRSELRYYQEKTEGTTY